jgi:predicted dinucleotide-binding enzyme
MTFCPNLTHGLNSTPSGSERVQRLVPETKVAKAFTICGFENYENPFYPGHNIKPVRMYCGQGSAAKKKAGDLIAQLGWNPLDMTRKEALHWGDFATLHSRQ